MRARVERWSGDGVGTLLRSFRATSLLTPFAPLPPPFVEQAGDGTGQVSRDLSEGRRRKGQTDLLPVGEGSCPSDTLDGRDGGCFLDVSVCVQHLSLSEFRKPITAILTLDGLELLQVPTGGLGVETDELS